MNVMKFCPECYKELPPQATTCPFCGHQTGNGNAEEGYRSPLSSTGEVSNAIPLEQTILSMMLILLLFGGLSISAVLLPVFIDQAYYEYLLITAISSQVLFRIPIGLWAVQEQSFHKNLSPEKKVGTFLLAFIPLGALIPFYLSAKTNLRRKNLSEITIGTIGALAVSALLVFSTADFLLSDSPVPEQIPAAAALVTPTAEVETGEIQNSETADESEAEPALVYEVDTSCKDPQSIDIYDEGQSVTVCGKVTNYGDIECPDCPNGYYSYIKLDSSFQIVSYDWRFTFAWLGDCLKIADEVEILGEDPVFVFGKGEGYAGTECITDAQGELVCDGGMYFQDYFGCQQ